MTAAQKKSKKKSAKFSPLFAIFRSSAKKGKKSFLPALDDTEAWSKLSLEIEDMMIIRNCIHYPWDFSALSKNSNITIELVIDFSNKPWDLFYFITSKSSKFKYTLVKALPDKDWDWNFMSSCDDLDTELVVRFHFKPWNWKLLSSNSAVTLDIWVATLREPWNYKKICERFDKTLK
tara:strand:- start:309 stop:839 length:531 start_codon:yes stop_codon:yes gene_type:complete